MPPFEPPTRSAGGMLLSHFSRVTSGGRFIPEIDGLRFVAISAVLTFHLAVNLEGRNPAKYSLSQSHDVIKIAVRSGDFGVQLFFIVSGFVLALPFAKYHLSGGARVSLKAYYLRRVTRLEPPYIIAMVAIFALLVVRGGGFSHLLPHVLASLAYLHTLVYGRDSLINNVAWSLEVEIQFYLLVPWLVAVFAVRHRARRRALICALIVFTSIVGPLLAGTSPHLENTILRFAQYFLVGFLLADLWIKLELRATRLHPAWDVAAVGCLALGIMFHTDSGVAHLLPGPPGLRQAIALILLPWICFVAYVAAFRGTVVNRVLTLSLITTIGGMCYSIYLWHNVLLNNSLFVTKNLGPLGRYPADLLLQAAIMFPFIIAFSAVFFVLIERPCMDKEWPTRLHFWIIFRSPRSGGSLSADAKQERQG